MFVLNNQSSATRGHKLQCEDTLLFAGATEMINHSLIFGKNRISLNMVVSGPDKLYPKEER